MIYRLIILNGDRRGEQVTVTANPMTIGRAATCDIRITDPEMALAHAEICHQPAGLFLRDLGSMNKILVNHREVHEARPKHGDVLEMGHTRFLVQAYVQAEVQESAEDLDDEDRAERRRLWLAGGGVALVVIALLAGVPRCERWLTAPRTKPVPAPAVAAPVRPPPQRAVPAPGPEGRTSTPVIVAPPPAAGAAPVPRRDEVAMPKRVSPEPAPRQLAPPLPQVKPQEEPKPAPAPAPQPVTTPEPSPASVLIDRAQKELAAASAFMAAWPSNRAEQASLATASVIPAPQPVAATSPAPSPAHPVTDTPPPSSTAKPQPAAPFRPVQIPEAKPPPPPGVPEPPPAHDANLIRIVSTDVSKFPETEQFREMRLLVIRLASTGLRKVLDPRAVRVEVRFLDRDLASGQIMTVTPRDPPPAVSLDGAWRSAEQKSVVASYVVPATNPPTERRAQYCGFVVRVYHQGVLQDEASQPRDLPPGLVPDSPPPGTLPAQ